jgi:hypothetical protein
MTTNNSLKFSKIFKFSVHSKRESKKKVINNLNETYYVVDSRNKDRMKIPGAGK